MVKKDKQGFFIDNVLKQQLDIIKKEVIKKDRDFVLVIDGDEGVGKSVLAQQIAKTLDDNFNLENICFNADQFIWKLKNSTKHTCIVLDEAYNSASSRGSLTEVNRSMVGVATEMRQMNLFVIIVLPSFFDLDKYFALWRCKSLIHVYFAEDGSRGRYVIFPKTSKKYLFLNGKKYYDYSKPKSPYPPCRFKNEYTVDETEYRLKKSLAFKRRVVSNQAKKWKQQRDSLINELYNNLDIRTSQFEKIFLKWGSKPIGMRDIQRIVQFDKGNEEIINEEEEN